MFEINTLLVGLLLVNFALLGASRLDTSVRQVAAQGALLSLLTLAEHAGWGAPWRVWLLALSSGAVKAVVFPHFLRRALREADVRREMEPYVGFTASVLVGVAALAASLWLASRLPLPGPVASPLLVPVALFTLLVGLFLLVSRRKALTQVVGYLVLENGVFCFGLALPEDAPLSVEVGILLDIFAAVFIMGIMIYHISREFDHIDTDRMSSLRDETT
jgi:hydrogenase-4 component E